MSAAGGTISLLVGIVLLRLTVTGVYARYVRVGLAPWLLVAGVAVTALGLVTVVRAIRHEPAVDAHEHAGERSRVGWLLLAPIPLDAGQSGADQERKCAEPARAGVHRRRHPESSGLDCAHPAGPFPPAGGLAADSRQ